MVHLSISQLTGSLTATARSDLCLEPALRKRSARREQDIGLGSFGAGGVHRVEVPETERPEILRALPERRIQCDRSLRHPVEVQDLKPPDLVRDQRDLDVCGFTADENPGAVAYPLQDGLDGLGFETHPHLGMIVEGPVIAAGVEVNAHGKVSPRRRGRAGGRRAASGGGSCPRPWT
jgi:hypothetical protein